MSDIGTDHDQEKAKRKTADAFNELVSRITPDQYVGDLISMDYDTAEVLIHDRLRQDVGGVPHGCILLATRIKSSDPPNLDNPQTSLILLRALKASSLPNDIENEASST